MWDRYLCHGGGDTAIPAPPTRASKLLCHQLGSRGRKVSAFQGFDEWDFNHIRWRYLHWVSSVTWGLQRAGGMLNACCHKYSRTLKCQAETQASLNIEKMYTSPHSVFCSTTACSSLVAPLECPFTLNVYKMFNSVIVICYVNSYLFYINVVVVARQEPLLKEKQKQCDFCF